MNLEKANSTWKEIRTTTKDSLSESNKKEKLKKLRRLTAELERELEEEVAGIDGFFETVGEGIIKAQKSLDVRTIEYLATRPAVPTAFRIPKTSAEIHFSASERSSGGFLAKIFTGDEETEKMTKHKVSFDVVAIPPPPEVIQQMGLSWLANFVVSDLLNRKRLKSVIEKLAVNVSTERDRLEKETGNNNPKVKELKAKYRRLGRFISDYSRTIILRGAGGYAFLLIFKGKQTEVLDILSLYDLEDLSNPANAFADKPKEDSPNDGVSQAPKGKALVKLLSDFVGEQETLLARLSGDMED